MSNGSSRDQARAVAGNLASLWNGGRDLLGALAGWVPDAGGNPWLALNRLDDHQFDAFLDADVNRERLHRAFQGLTHYLTEETWFDRTTRDDGRLGYLRAHPIAYFCAEFGLAGWLPLYSGGLGILAGDVLKEASDMGLPMVAVGLFYRHGYFSQHLDAAGYQTESYPSLRPADYPFSPAQTSDGSDVLVSVRIGDREVSAQVWELRVGRTRLLLLDTDVEHNARPEDRQITANLYGGDSDTRIRQELVLGIGGVMALRAMNIDPAIYSMNEGHAAFLGIELLIERARELGYEAARENVRARSVYTNHTVVPAGNDIFDRDRVRALLGPYVEQAGLGVDRLLSLGARGADSGFSMPELAFHLSGKANAVSELHARVIPAAWPGYSVEAVTNGVHAPTWLGSSMTSLLDRHVPDWRSDSPSWDRLDGIPAEELWAVRETQRAELVEWVNARSSGGPLVPEALTIVWARRFAEYKRAWLLASDMQRLARLVADAERPLQFVIAGKAHPRDEGGKRVLQDLLGRLCSDAAVAKRVVFVEDYSEDVAQVLCAGADLWLNTPRKPLEASGTSGMKAGDNGGLQLTVKDGWAAEVDWYGIGWGIDGRDDDLDAQDLYAFLEGSIVPTFFTRNERGVPEEWTAMMKRTMCVTFERYSSRRMMLDYLYKLYLPLIERQIVTSGSAST